MSKKLLIFSVLSLFVLNSCDESSNPKTEDKKVENPFKSAVVEQNNSFSIDIFAEIVTNEDDGKNIFISPLSMYYALAMAATGSATETKQEFVNLLGWNNLADEDILEAMKELSADLKPTSEKVKLEIANSLWQREGFPIKQSYKAQTQEYFDAEVRELDFTSSEAVEVINSWIEVKTNNLIQDMLDQISSDATMYLINAIYYKADWLYKFDEDASYEAPFIKEDASEVSATFMTQKTNLEYLSNDLFESVKLPYADSNFYMIVLLPKATQNTNEFINQLSESNWSQWNSQYNRTEVIITLPRFKFDYGVKNINAELKALGLLKAYSPSEADFSGITDQQIFISRVLHKAFIEVNEQGSEAAAATIIEFENTSVGEDIHLKANRPFVFTICHEPSNTILFMGKLSKPE